MSVHDLAVPAPLDASETTISNLRASIERVYALHDPYDTPGGTYCHHCSTLDEYGPTLVAYPCPTITSIERPRP